jgi:hypothetical protein
VEAQHEASAMGEHGAGRDAPSARAADNPIIVGRGDPGKASLYRVTPPDGGKPTLNAVKGRPAWALDRLIAAGPLGCTPITEPAPRWSGYVHVLRRLGVPIETVHEWHGGAFPGRHARYVLRGDVRRIGE